ncbi:hypothetical protein COR50_08085 [Chitinophaga caeni]|uniref:Lipoprotein n=1 Tax=Chitinophaga caeni TaxID=2029983 RepID=A0A291QT72_9BACT|nr:hypothetical protein [Chitinophaga caeni]ATL47146.1 hypothetical protein COR50_08085 [Chitinophaga caeni]
MKIFAFIFCCSYFLAIACNQTSKKPSEADSTMVKDSTSAVPADANLIDDYIQTADDLGESRFAYLTANNYRLGNKEYNAVVMITRSLKPMRIFLSVEKKSDNNLKKGNTYADRWFYIDTVSNKVLFLREVLTSDTSKDVIENRFYYDSNEHLLKNVSFLSTEKPRSIDNEISYQPLSTATDYSKNIDQVNNLAHDIVDKMNADRPGLSPAANEARRHGATIWATGNEPGWNLTVYPHYKIVFVNNYGKDTLEFPYTKEIRTENGGEATSKNGQHEIHIQVINQVCNDDADGKNPFSVNITLDNKKYFGCGKLLN